MTAALDRIDWNADPVSPEIGKRCRLRDDTETGIARERKVPGTQKPAQFWIFEADGQKNAFGPIAFIFDAKGRALGADTSRHIHDCVEVLP